MAMGKPEDGRAVARAKIDDRPLVTGDQPVDLADVDVREPPSHNHAHRPIIPLGGM